MRDEVSSETIHVSRFLTEHVVLSKIPFRCLPGGRRRVVPCCRGCIIARYSRSGSGLLCPAYLKYMLCVVRQAGQSAYKVLVRTSCPSLIQDDGSTVSYVTPGGHTRVPSPLFLSSWMRER